MREQYSKLKILVVDDEPSILEVLCRVFEWAGFNVHKAEDGQIAWDMYQILKPHIVVSDIYMPNMTGLTLLHNIKKTDENSIVVLITGIASYKEKLQESDVQPDGLLSKPLNLETIGNLVEDLLRKHKLVT